jgi:hypothetical protein
MQDLDLGDRPSEPPRRHEAQHVAAFRSAKVKRGERHRHGSVPGRDIVEPLQAWSAALGTVLGVRHFSLSRIR